VAAGRGGFGVGLTRRFDVNPPRPLGTPPGRGFPHSSLKKANQKKNPSAHHAQKDFSFLKINLF
jgi:hypothetical protein